MEKVLHNAFRTENFTDGRVQNGATESRLAFNKHDSTSKVSYILL